MGYSYRDAFRALGIGARLTPQRPMFPTLTLPCLPIMEGSPNLHG